MMRPLLLLLLLPGLMLMPEREQGARCGSGSSIGNKSREQKQKFTQPASCGLWSSYVSARVSVSVSLPVSVSVSVFVSV